MRTTLDLDDRLMRTGQEAGGGTLSRSGSSARSRLAVSTAARRILPGLLLEQRFHLQ